MIFLFIDPHDLPVTVVSFIAVLGAVGGFAYAVAGALYVAAKAYNIAGPERRARRLLDHQLTRDQASVIDMSVVPHARAPEQAWAPRAELSVDRASLQRAAVEGARARRTRRRERGAHVR